MNPFKAFNNILKKYISPEIITELPKRWSERHRHYHALHHLIQILQDIEKSAWFTELSLVDKHALLLAAFFHDIIYDPKRTDNEDKSIEYFLNSYISRDIKLMYVVRNLIEVTKYRKRPFGKLEKIFWEADNAGFRKGFSHLMKNEKLLQKEFAHVPREKYKKGKIEFIKSNIGLFGHKVDKDLHKIIQYYNEKI